jgi:tetratricopeptide (TPR) repeat protein
MAAANQDLTIEEARRALEGGRAARAEEVCAKLAAAEPKNAEAWHVLGLARHKLGQPARAVEALAKATSLDRTVARYHHDLGSALIDEGKIDRAISSFRRALRIDDTVAEAHNDLGTAYFEKKWYAEAEGCFRKAIGFRPDHGVAHANLGAALRAQGKFKESRNAFQRALVLKVRNSLPAFLRWKVAAAPATGAPAAPSPDRERLAREAKAVTDAVEKGLVQEALDLAIQSEQRFPGEPDVLHACAIALEENRRLDEALAKITAAIAAKPDRAEYHITLARIHVRAWRFQEALEAAKNALRLEPGSAAVFATIAGIYHPWRDDLAAEAARHAIELEPACAPGHGNLAAALWGEGRLEEAERHAREAVRLKPNQLSFKANLGLILKDLGRIEEAQALYRDMIRDAPDYPKVCMDMGTLAIETEGDLEAARRWFQKAQSLSDNPRAILSEGIANLLDGRFETAWSQYEARKRVLDQRYQHSLFARFPQWRGEALGSDRLLVYGEQGLGDEIMFASMFGDLAKRVGNVSLMCDARLGRLFARSFPGFEVIAEPREAQEARVAGLQGISCAAAAGSLGEFFRRRAEDFPRHPGYLSAEASKVAMWREQLENLGPGLKVGLSWIGGLQRSGRSRRSLSLERLRPLLSVSGVAWISLQYTDSAAEVASFGNSAGIPIQEFPGVTRDMDDLAGLIGALDLVVSVCNTTVHVAGATGKEVLVLAPFVPEWRYGMRGERMIWYPSARVFRQAKYGEWDAVIAQVAKVVAERCGATIAP